MIQKVFQIQKTFQIMKREWENIRLSLRMCGDIGEFDSSDFVNGGSECLSLFRNITEMEHKLPGYGYSTCQAAYVFSTLASKAGERLGLKGEFVQAFGGGYSWVRTGWFDLDGSIEEHHLIKRMLFLKLFSPFGGDFTSWDFRSPVANTKLKLVFNTFIEWQSDPKSYSHDIREYGTQIGRIRHGLSLAPISSTVFTR